MDKFFLFYFQNPDYMKDGFKLIIETVHAPDRGTQENVHRLSPDLLKQREVVYIDIANDSVSVCILKAILFLFLYQTCKILTFLFSLFLPHYY